MAKTIIEKKTRPDGTKYVLVKLSHDTEKIRPLRADQKPYEAPKPTLSGKSLKPYARIASRWKSKHKLAGVNIQDKELSQKEFMKQQAYLISQLDQGEKIPTFDETKVRPFQIKKANISK